MAEHDKHRDELEVPMHFLDRIHLWDTIKPYTFQYYPKEDIPRHNFQHSSRAVQVRSMRCRDPPASLEVEGFAIHRLPTTLQRDDFFDDKKVQDVYCRELEEYFLGVLGAKHVRAMDYQLRRKSPGFPYFGGKLPDRPQPSLMTHADVTPEAAKTITHDLFGDLADTILQSHYQIITVWRPLRVPVQDWPLAICDARTVDQADLVPTDVIYPTFVTENYMVHFNEKNRWYWLPDQKADEVLVFKAVDSDEPSSCPCPHGAFPLPEQEGSATAPTRESIDIRLLVLYADIDYPGWESNLGDNNQTGVLII